MSSRFSLYASSNELHERFEVDVPPAYKPTYNAAPGQLLPVITNTGPQGVSFFYWGLAPVWAKNKPISEKIFTVRLESMREKASVKKSLKQQRCIVPADGFYEWKKIGKRTAIPYRYQTPDKTLFSFAALWEEYEDEGEDFHTFSIITVPPAVGSTAFVERIPAILTKQSEQIWLSNSLDEEEWFAVLTSREFDKMDCYTISPRINSMAANDPQLIAPTPPTDQFGNLTLFD